MPPAKENRQSMNNARFTAEDHTWLICAYRESPFLEECIRSLQGQTVRSRILVCTSTPNEHIRRLTEKYGLETAVNPAAPGIGSDWNFALRSGETELLTIAHQDDVYEPEYTEEMLRRVNRHKNTILYFSDYAELRNGKKVASNRLLRIKRLLLVPLRLFPGRVFARRLSLAFGDPICCPSVTYRKSVMGDREFGSRFRSDLDWEMMEGLSREKGRFVFDPGRRLCHRIHADSATTEIIGDHLRTREDYEMMKKFWPDFIAKRLSRVYAASEKSNRTEG